MVFAGSLFRSERFALPELNSISEPEAIFQDKNSLSRLNLFTKRLEQILGDGDYDRGKLMADSLQSFIKSELFPDEKYLAKSFYLIGFSKAVKSEYAIAMEYFNKAISVLGKYPDENLRGRVYYMMAFTASNMGDYYNAAAYSNISLDSKKKQYGNLNFDLVTEYISIAANNNGLRNYETAIEYADEGFKVANANPDYVDPENVGVLYQVKGSSLMATGDYNKGNLNFEKALEVFERNSLQSHERYISILDNLGTSFYYLGKFDKCSYYYNKGIASRSGIDGMYINLCYNYALILAEQKRGSEGEKVLEAALGRSKRTTYGEIRDYYDLLCKYADYLREYNINLDKSREHYIDCYSYLSKNPDDIILGTRIITGYAMVLYDLNKPMEALDTIQSLIVKNSTGFSPADLFDNPGLSNLKPDKVVWDILGVKYKILRKLYSAEKRFEILESAAKTADLRIAVFDLIRIKIGEEGSRILLGETNRDAYLEGIESYNLCYTITGRPEFLEKAFEISEKSKAASLLASAREMKAIKYHVPAELADNENSLQREISLYEAEIARESNKLDPDTAKLSGLRDYALTASNKSDSLRKYFEKKYPEYYALKYDTRVIKTDNVTGLLGKRSNYISYVLSDSSLYILLINKKYKKLVTVNSGAHFNDTIARFKNLLTNPSRDKNARKEFADIQRIGYKLYKLLIDPVRQYFISGKLIISPDNELAYFPFEDIITDSIRRTDLFYNRLSYLMNDHRISYTYSATFLAESERAKPSLFNRLVAFAPAYDKNICVDSLTVKRQSTERELPDLKYAREEAIAVSGMTSGKLFLGNEATEEAYKSEAGNYDIIHLAMHTVIRDDDPLNSGMVFSAGKDSTRSSGSLGTYEITGIPLKAKMVVLSSCYTGTGEMFKGEGVLSLARGFIFSGSQSVVMSLWEVNDRSGTEIVESFYRNLKAGNSKSDALRKARIKYLKAADQLHSHPFFWSTLVVYGDDSPLYFSLPTKCLVIIIPLLLIASGFIYFKRR
jgi:CHAT domain-containing protein